MITRCETDLAEFDSIKLVCGECDSEVYIKSVVNKLTVCPNCGNKYHYRLIEEAYNLLFIQKDLKQIKDKFILVHSGTK